MGKLVIGNCLKPTSGWQPVHRLVSIMKRVFDAEVVEMRPERSRLKRLKLALPFTTPPTSEDTFLAVISSPTVLGSLVGEEPWSRYGRISVLCTDSFWTELIPKLPYARMVSNVFTLTGHDIKGWRRRTGANVTVLPWGADTTMARSSFRDIDLLRVGRQPAAWEDDAGTGALAEERGMSFRGRPPEGTYQDLIDIYGRTKIALASTNLIDPPAYVHQSREYLTGRWTDAVASGARVAGVPPRGDPSFAELMTEDDLIEISGTDRVSDMRVIETALAHWSEDDARRRMARARERLDWRHRIRTVADVLGLPTERLDREIAALEEPRVPA